MKSYVTLEKRVCKVCACAYDTGAILMDRRLQATFDSTTLVGYGMCSACDKLDKDGYIALVEIDPTKSIITNGLIKPEDAYRTGNVLHFARRAARQVFNVEVPDTVPLWFVEPAVIKTIKERAGL